MEQDGFVPVRKESHNGKQESEMTDIQEMLSKVDKVLAEFYEIHRPHFKDPADRP